MKHQVTFENDGDAVTINLPDGRGVRIWWNDIEPDDALPQLEIDLPAPMVANCWLNGLVPSTPLDGAPNALLAVQIAIPIEPDDV